MSRFEFGSRGAEGVSTEGATGWDELRYVPYNGDHGKSMAERAEEISRNLKEITSDEASPEGDQDPKNEQNPQESEKTHDEICASAEEEVLMSMKQIEESRNRIRNLFG